MSDPAEIEALEFADQTLVNVPEGMQASVLVKLVEERLKADKSDAASTSFVASVVFVARDGPRMQRMAEILRQMMPGHPVLTFPAWDCLPYDRVSPNAVSVAARMDTLAKLLAPETNGAIVLTASNALVQKVVPVDVVKQMSFVARAGMVVDSKRLIEWANINGYLRVPTVREPGEFAVRGGLIDLFPAGKANPIRFDFFGLTLESLRTFDADSQRTKSNLGDISLVPMSEIIFTPETIRNFRTGYTSAFGGNTVDDPLYAAISAGQRYAGAEHWLPLFYDKMNSLADYCAGAPFVFDEQVLEAVSERRLQIRDYYQARINSQAEKEQVAGRGAKYNPIDPALLYDLGENSYGLAGQGKTIQFSGFSGVPSQSFVSDFGGRIPASFAAERQSNDINLFEAVVGRLSAAVEAKKCTIIACWSEGTRDRMAQVLVDHGLKNHKLVGNWHGAKAVAPGITALVILGLEHGFETNDMLVLSEQDILGERLVRGQRRRKVKNALKEASSLAAGDFVVHVDHGIGRFIGLKAIQAAGAPHDCVEIEYARGDKLYLPVENIELLTRYGEGSSSAQLDRLGGVAWQAKKAQLKNRIRIMAEQLIKVAAKRALLQAEPVELPTGAYDEFVTRFQFEETEDQLAAIDAIMEDISSGKVMDRLVCGDVGFGKTEVALRAAFCVALSGKQVAVVVPTTLLARQHFKTFSQRFAGLPVRVAQASRLVPAGELRKVKQGLEDGSVDIVIGTHALLAKTVKFFDLGLLVVDEEQHFGVGHKEQLKELKSAVHVLTLTATPIPRTLQMALTGVRDLSLLATPPVDRLAIRTFIAPFDGLSVREALLRENIAAGRRFMWCRA